MKKEGSYVHGKWFCSDEHAEADPTTMSMIKMMQRHKERESVDLEALEKKQYEDNLKALKETGDVLNLEEEEKKESDGGKSEGDKKAAGEEPVKCY